MIERIQLILKTLSLTPTRLADEISVQRSSVSHILSGRNKPSLDFIMKILSTYPEINSDWLLFGKGQMFKIKNKSGQEIKEEKQEIKAEKTVEPIKEVKLEESPSEKQGTASNVITEKIILFYSDGTFREYVPGNKEV